jgi:hypothetical protein
MKGARILRFSRPFLDCAAELLRLSDPIKSESTQALRLCTLFRPGHKVFEALQLDRN